MWLTLRNTLGPLFLILFCPPIVMLMWYTNTALEGSLTSLWLMMSTKGVLSSLFEIWQPYFWGNSKAWIIIGTFILSEVLLMRFLPGKNYQGPISPKGNIPLYKDNGVLSFVVTMACFSIASFGFNLFDAALIYDNLGSILGALNVFSLFFCGFLYLKGRFYPSSNDSSVSQNLLFDYYWGTELYPKLLNLPIKQFIACRFGMMSWGLLLLSYCAKQSELSGLSNSLFISVALQFLYIAKFFLWETGYLSSLDMMHDRAGFYICWGCLVWVPCIYTSPSMYLVQHPIHLSVWWSAVILILGTAAVLINYQADKQRMLVRASKGNCKIWGKKPIVLSAKYKTAKGETEKSLLLASGWWGLSRHFHYIPEIACSFFWTVPALFTHFLPYFYVCYLSILLLDRAYRDDRRCAKKYGEDWNHYCELVPYKIVPFLL